MTSEVEFRTTVSKRPGRPVRAITGDFFITPPTAAQAAVVAKKNNGGNPVSWQAVANELGEEVGETFSGALMYRIAKGEIESDRVEQALGIKPKTAPAPVCPTCGDRSHGHDCGREKVITRRQAAEQTRTRIAADVTPAQRATLTDNLNHCGVSRSWFFGRLGELGNRQFSELVRLLSEKGK